MQSFQYWGISPRHYAALKNKAACCSYLLKKNADARIKNKAGKTPQELATDVALKAALEPGQARAGASQLTNAAAPEPAEPAAAGVGSSDGAAGAIEASAPADVTADALGAESTSKESEAGLGSEPSAEEGTAPPSKRRKAGAKPVVPLHLMADDDDNDNGDE